jgi:hypothetical protein
VAHRLLSKRRMPSFTHETLVELFRNRGELATALLDGHAHIAFSHHRVEQASIDLSQVVSTEYRADAVTVLRDVANTAVAAIIVEVQLGIDHDKEYSWPVYVPALRARLRCPVVLLVVAPEPEVARWARASIELGHPRFCLEPLVIEFTEMPRVTNGAEAQRVPELAVLSAIAHPEISVARAAIDAIENLPTDKKRIYLILVAAALSSQDRKTLEAYMLRSEIIQKQVDERYYELGRQDGLFTGLQTAALALLRAKLDIVTAAQDAAVRHMYDERVLNDLIATLIHASTGDDALAALAAASARTAPTAEQQALIDECRRKQGSGGGGDR